MDGGGDIREWALARGEEEKKQRKDFTNPTDLHEPFALLYAYDVGFELDPALDPVRYELPWLLVPRLDIILVVFSAGN